MIYKSQLLDAYLTLSGSHSQHMAMLITLIIMLGDYDELSDGSTKDQLTHYWKICISTHTLTAFFKLASCFRQISTLKTSLVADAVLVFLNIYLCLLSIELFAMLQSYDIASGNSLDPNKNHIKTSK